MKKKCSIVILLMLLLSACGQSEEKYLAALGEEKVNVNSDFSKTHEMVNTDEGVYKLEDFVGVQYIEWSTGKSLALCSKPNCSHFGEECNAYLSTPHYIYAYGDYMYIVADSSDNLGMSLYRISFDGSEKQELYRLVQFDENDSDKVSLYYQFIIHKGYGYFVCNRTYNDLETEFETPVYKIELKKNGEMKEIFSVKGYDNAVFFCGKNDTGIYVKNNSIKDISKRPYEKSCDNYYIDVTSGEVECIEELENKGLYSVNGDCGYYVDGTKYMMFNFKDKSLKEIIDCGTEYEVFYDEKYMYVDTHIGVSINELPLSERIIYVYTYDGELVKTYEGLKDSAVVAINDDNLMIMEESEEDGSSVFSIKNME